MKCREKSESLVELFTSTLMNPNFRLIVVSREVVEICLEALDTALKVDEQKDGE